LALLQSDFSVGEQRVHGIGGDFIAMEAKESFIGSFAGQLLFIFLLILTLIFISACWYAKVSPDHSP
jgi:hypothetical protein